MSVELVLNDEYEFFDNVCKLVPTKFDIGIHSYIYPGHDLEDVLTDCKAVAEAIENELEFCDEFDKEPLFESIKDQVYKITNNDVDKYIEKLNNLAQDILCNVEWVRIAFNDKKKVKSFIYNNSYILSKKIILPEYLSITDLDKAKALYEDYYDIKDIIYVPMENNNYNYVKIEDAYNAILKIKEITDETKSMEMSPAEEIMYAYDQVRKRIYKLEDEDEDRKVSRDLIEVLNNDTIVCEGFANSFSAVLTGLDIPNRVVYLSKPGTIYGHSRNVAYIKDFVYGIDGVYYFDPTFDCRKKDNNNDYISTYKYFAKTKKEMDKLDKKIYKDIDLPYYSDKLVEEVKELLENGEYEKINEDDLFDSITYMSKLLYDERLFNRLTLVPFSPYYGKIDKEDILNKLEEMQRAFNSPLKAEVYVELLNNVRKKEYYKDPDTYPYTLNDLFRTYNRSGWLFDRHYYNQKEKLLKAIFNEEPTRDESDNYALDFVNYTCCEHEMDKEINEVRFTKVLSLFNQNRK